MNINTINDTGSAQTVAAVKPEAIPAGQQVENTQVEQNPAGKATTTNSSQAVLVALESTIAAELTELTQTVANRTALVKSLPPEIRELVQQLLSQNQAGQTTLSEGLVTLLQSPKTGAEKLVMLADMLEKAGLPVPEGQAEASTPAATGKQQLLTQLAAALQGMQPDDLQAAAKVLRDLVAAVQPNEQQNTTPETSENMARPNVAGNKQQAMPVTTPPQSSELVLRSKTSNQGADAKQSEAPKQQGSSPNKPQELLTKPAMPTGDSGKPQELTQLLKNVIAQPKLLESLPPDIRKIVLTMLQQEEPAAQTTQQQAPQAAQSGQTTQQQTPQTPQSAQQQAPQATQSAQSPQTLQTPTSQLVTSTSATPAQQMQTLSPALAGIVTSINKSEKSPKEKIIVLANALEQVAELLAPKQSQATQQLALRQQAMADLTNIWQGESPEELKAAIKVLQELAGTMSKASGVTAERQDAQRVLTFAVPLYFGEGQTAYPAYVHVYHHEEEDKKNPGQKVTETWLRICLETENIGIVDTAFHLYDENILDVKVRFTDTEAAAGFANSMEEVKEQLGQLPLTLGEFLVK